MDKKKCEYCGESIHINTRRCPFCGSIVSEIPKEVIKEEEPLDTLGDAVAGPDTKEQLSNNEGDWTPDVMSNGNLQKPLSNAIKVFITSLACIIPGFGQLLGIIFAVIFMSDEQDGDRRSFGKALMVVSLVIFALISLCCIIYAVFAYSIIMTNPDLKFK